MQQLKHFLIAVKLVEVKISYPVNLVEVKISYSSFESKKDCKRQ
jgi:hypothetical protein